MAEKYFGATDPGRQRNNNEDSFIAEPVMKDRFIAACVIDGVGGYEGGEVAAALARQSLLNYFSVPSGTIITMMQEAMVSANEKIYREKQKKETLAKMACVATMALIEKGNNKFYYAHVGDTRLYLFRDGSLVKVTKDHSFVGFLEDSGRLDEAAAMTHPKRNEINKALGFEAPLQNVADYIETGESPFLPGDLLLLCSDGLTDMIDKSAIINILSSNNDLSSKAAVLIAAANNAGGKDNITVVLVQNDREPVRLEPTKPVKKNEAVNRTVKDTDLNTPRVSVQKTKNTSGLTIALGLLALLFLAAFLWQLMKNRGSADGAAQNTLHTDNKARQANLLQDTLRNMDSRVLDLTEPAFTDIVFVPDTLRISNDSFHIRGVGNTILTADTAARQNAIIMIMPSVRYLLFDSLTIQDINILVPGGKQGAVHFNHVRMQNANYSTQLSLPDTMINGVIQLKESKDSTIKTKNR